MNVNKRHRPEKEAIAVHHNVTCTRVFVFTSGRTRQDGSFCAILTPDAREEILIASASLIDLHQQVTYTSVHHAETMRR